VPSPPPEVPRVVERPSAKARANGIELAWDSFGDERAPPLLLIMGLGMQMIGWDEALCEQLAARGFRVIRFDNRDVGQSTWMDATGEADPLRVWNEMMKRRARPPSAYTIVDLAEDAVGLLDALGIRAAHLAGVSMGGMIAQQIALAHPERVLSLTSIMSSTGEADVRGPSFETLAALLEPFPSERGAFIERSLKLHHTIGSPGFPRDEALLRRLAARSFDRGYHPAGMKRQLIAIWASPGRRAALASLKIPTVVFHGDADPLLPVENGVDTARAIPGARLIRVPGMGHDLPREIWRQLIDAIVSVAGRASLSRL
jgi:pimeloyl-ACP methyl ester carboxylesterase